jgi:hypothetical protein
MTWGTEQKRHMLTRYRKCMQHSFPKGVTKVINDGMPDVKFKPDGINTIQDYIQRHVLRHVKEMLEDPTKNISHFYCVLDRGRNAAKALFTYHKRNREIPPMPEPVVYPFVLPTEGNLPKLWDSLIANRELTRREVYPLFKRGLIDTYVPPVGKCVVLDGAPDHPLDKNEYEETKDTAFTHVHFSHHYAQDPFGPSGMAWSRENTVMATPIRQNAGPYHHRGVAPPEDYTHGCVEGDLSAFFYVNKHFKHAGNVTNDDILIDSNDGDTVMIALLHARDRIDPVSGRFYNRVWVKLRGQKKTREAYIKRKEAAIKAGKPWVEDVIDGRDIYININMLYILIKQDPELGKAQYPVLTAVTLHILSGTDFFGDFTGDQYALFYWLNWEKHVWDTWCKHAERFSHMIMMFYSAETTFNQPNLLRRPYINEAAFIEFIYQCYGAKYGADVRVAFAHLTDDNGNPVRVTPTLLEEFTARFAGDMRRKKDEPDDKWNKRHTKALKRRIPPKHILTRFVRLALGNVIYWVNDYRPGGQTMFDPLEKYKGFPYYGFMKDPTDETGHRFTLSPVCSPPKPTPDFCVPFLTKHKDRRPKKPLRQRSHAPSALPDLDLPIQQPPIQQQHRAGIDQEERLKKQREFAERKKQQVPAKRPVSATK